MTYTGFNMSSIKTANRASVLYLLNGSKQLSRKDIAESLGLTPAAVSKICAELIAEGAINECGSLDCSAGAGRKKIILSLNSKEIFVLAIGIDKKGFNAAVCTLDGEEKCGERFLFEKDASPEKCLCQAAKKSLELLKASGILKEKVIGAGVGIVGGADKGKGTTAGNYGVWRPGVAVRSILEKELSMPVAIENNVKAFALASLIFDRRHFADNILFVKWGPGVGSAIVIGGAVLGKTDSDSSEIGHYIAVPNGEKCRCKRNGCLETVISADALVCAAKSLFGKKTTPCLFELTGGDETKIDISKVLLASKADAPLGEKLLQSVRLLAKAVTNASAVIAPDRVVVFGYMFTKEIFESFERECEKLYPAFKKGYIGLSPLDEKHNFIGPAAVAAKSFFFEKGNK